MQTPEISVIIPIYNSILYIRQCLESVINQSFKNLEILCIDAYSNDGTAEILEEFATKDARIIIIKSEKKSLGAQINLGLAKAKGKYFCIVESDDYTHLKMCEVLHKLIEEKNCDIVKADICAFKKVFLKTHFNYKSIAYEQALYGKILFLQEDLNPLLKSWNMNQSSLYRLDFVKQFKIKANESLGASYQDTGLWILFLSFAKTLYFHNEALYFYRLDNANSSSLNKEKIYCVCDEFDFAQSFLKQYPGQKIRLQEALTYVQFKVYWWNFKRLANRFKKEFALYFAKEFQKKYADKRINEAFFNQAELQILKALMNDPEHFVKTWLSFNFILRKRLARYKRKIITFVKIKK
ncbi:glycosyltransferase family 2 protein [Campylobacter sp. MIT 12-8780]|uniref:glycosyltransferase family 2 protein n=1 Tax=unclassified Campylobacter TaxID=2593542 RepID=UPI00115C53EA|nr:MULTISPECIES: glycosyltransferase family 2 protein [unclassified Campylobacter]NDJ28156.1 glycosyltransferase family 2 protein [Campylobacter sp. MIT 19-121]TQR39941.1 glycosyltransferase family 2 protein [Campylobacter sp. MIT 12-8780]